MPASTSAPEVLPDATEALADEPGLVALAGQAIDEGKALIAAEIALAKARLSERLAAYRGAVALFAVAGVLALAALVALLVGLILTLATLIGPGGATAVVVGVVLALAAILALIGRKRLAPPVVSHAA